MSSYSAATIGDTELISIFVGSAGRTSLCPRLLPLGPLLADQTIVRRIGSERVIETRKRTR
jgi:hypothetical protein